MRSIKSSCWALLLVFVLSLTFNCARKEESLPIRFIDILEKKHVLDSPLKTESDDASQMAAKNPGLDDVTDKFILEDYGIGENPYSLKKKMRIGLVDINALLAPPKTHLQFPFRIPEKAFLEFTYGIMRDREFRKDGTGRKTNFVVFFESGRRKIELFNKTLELTDLHRPLVFNLRKIELSDFGGEQGKLHFITTGDEESLSFWFNPVVYQPQDETSNVILISLDTLRADHLGCYGYKRNTSPNIDALAEDSSLFLNTYAPSPWTLPSHVSLMSSLNTINHGVYKNGQKIDASIITLADFLRTNGFFTTAYTGGGFVSGLFGLHKGFDSYHVRGGIQNPKSAEVLCRAALDWLSRNRDRSFFLFLHTYQIHNPYRSPPPYNEMFLQEGAEYKGIDTNDLRIARENRFKPLSDELSQNIIDLYDAGIRYTDECLIKPLVAKLRELELYDRTMIVLVSDHGEEFFDHRAWIHTHSVYDEVIKVPLIVKFFDSRHGGQKIEDLVRLIDVMPTVLDLLGIDFSGHFLEGKSLVPLLPEMGEDHQNKDRIFISDLAANIENNRIPGKITLNHGRYKIIINEKYSESQLVYFVYPPPAMPEIEIYDLKTDPGERNNLAFSHPELVEELLDFMKKHYLPATQRKASEVELSEDIRRQLRALGYIK